MPGLRLSCQFVNIVDGLYKGNFVSIESKLSIWYLILNSSNNNIFFLNAASVKAEVKQLFLYCSELGT